MGKFALGRRPVALRLVSGFGANMLGKIWVLLIQLVQVPVLTSAWGSNGYGVWLMIITIPTFIALSDFGLGTAAGVDLTRAVSRGDYVLALRIYQSVWAFLTFVSGVVCLSAIVATYAWLILTERPYVITSGEIDFSSIFLTISLCIAYSFFGMQSSIQKVVFQATNKYALGTIINDLWFLGGGIGVLCVGMFKGSMVYASLALLGVQFAGFIVSTLVLCRSEPWARQGWRHADMATIKRLIHPSLAALSLTLANSVGLQGVVLTIGVFLGPATAATFGTCRMLSRIPLQFSGLVVRASLPELIRAREAGDSLLTKQLMRINVGLSVAVVAPMAFLLILIGQNVLSHISHGQLSASWSTFALLGLAATLNACWASLGSLLLAENRQSAFGYLAIIVYMGCAASPVFFRTALMPTLLLQCLAEALILAQVVRTTSSMQAEYRLRTL